MIRLELCGGQTYSGTHTFTLFIYLFYKTQNNKGH